MSMHLEKPYLTTTSYKKKQQKITKAQQEELERQHRERNKRLKEMGQPKESFEQFCEWVFGRGKKTKSEKAPSQPMASKAKRSKTAIECNAAPNGRKAVVDEPKSKGEWITGAVSSKPSPTYTGTQIIGIGTMHKSNMVPIFSDEEAQDISKMRR